MSEWWQEEHAEMWQAIPARFRGARLGESTPEPIAGDLVEWAANPTVNLVLAGPVGTGKTYNAVAACYAASMAHPLTVQFSPVVELFDALRPGGPDSAFRSASTAGLLILDDLGGERATDWSDERLFALINRRWLENRATVVTTNYDPATLEPVIGPRTFSRLFPTDTLVLLLGGPDRRRQR